MKDQVNCRCYLWFLKTLKKIGIIFFMLMLFYQWSIAQQSTLPIDLEVETSVPESVTVCGDPVSFTVQVKNISGATLTNLSFFPHMPEGLEYVSNTAVGMSEAAPVDGNLRFLISAIEPGQTLTLSYKGKAVCDLINQLVQGEENVFVKNNTRLTYTLGGENKSYYEPFGSNSYNVLYPNIEVAVHADDKSLTPRIMSEVLNRRINIRNTGKGRLKAELLKFYIKADPELSILNLYVANANWEKVGEPIPGVFNTETGKVEYTFSANHLALVGNGDGFLDKNERLRLLDEVQVNKQKASIKTDFIARWGCAEGTLFDICNDKDKEAEYAAYIQASSGFLDLAISRSVKSRTDLCNNQDKPAIVEYTITNRGSGNVNPNLDAAFNCTFELSSTSVYNGDYDFFIKDNATDELVLIPDYIIVEPYGSINDNVLRFSELPQGLDLDGPGGLEDLDGDGVFDDLAPNESFTIVAHLRFDLKGNIDIPGLRSSDEKSFTFRKDRTQVLADDWSGIRRIVPGHHWALSYNFNINQTFINGALDLLPQTIETYSFYFETAVASLPLIECPNGVYRSELQLPPTYEIVEDELFNALEVEDLGNNKFVIIDKNGLIRSTYAFKLNFKIKDGGCELDSQSEKFKIIWDLYYICDRNCDDRSLQLVTNKELEVYNHCLEKQDIYTSDFSVKRTTLGYVPPAIGHMYTYGELYIDQTVPRVNPAEHDINLQNAYPLDEVKAIVKGKVLNGEHNTLYVKIRYDSPVPENILSLLNARFVVNDDPNNIIPCSFDDPNSSCYGTLASIEGTPTWEYTFYYSGAGLPANTSIDLEADYKIEDKISTRGLYLLYNFRGYHGIDELVKSQSFGENFNLSVPELTILQNNTSYNCEGKVDLFNYSWRRGGSIFSDAFPNEFRVPLYPQQITIELPVGFKFDTSKELEYRSMGIVNKISSNKTRFYDNDTKVVIEASFYDYLISSSNRSNNIFFYGVIMKNADYLPDLDNEIDIRRYDADMVFQSHAYSNFSFSDSKARRLSFLNQKNTKIALTANSTQEGFSSTVKWPVQVCNISQDGNTITPEFTWVAVELEDDDNSTIMQRPLGSSVLGYYFYGPKDEHHPNGRHMMVKMGRLPRGNCHNIDIEASYVNCQNDKLQKLKVYSSWSCTKYPPLEGSEQKLADVFHELFEARIHEAEMFIRYKIASLQWAVNKGGPELVPLCMDVPFEINLLNPRFGDMKDLELEIEIPHGASLSPSSLKYQYPLVGGDQPYYSINNFIKDGTKLRVNLSALLPGGVLSGTRTDNNKMKVVLAVYPGCDFNPGKPVQFTLRSLTNCNNPVILNHQRKILLEGMPLDDILVNVVANKFIGCNSTNQVKITLKNNGGKPSSRNVLSLTLPAQVKYEGVFQGTSAPKQGQSDAKTILTWELPAGYLGIGEEKSFTVLTSIGNELASVDDFTYYAESVMYGEVECLQNGTTCQVTATTGEDSYALSMADLFAQVSISASENLPVCRNTQITLSPEVTGNFAPSEYRYFWTPMGTSSKDITFTTSSSYTYTLKVTTPKNCSTIASLFVEVEAIDNLVPDLEIEPELDCVAGKATLRVDEVTGATYQWMRTSGDISGEVSNAFETSSPGLYGVRISFGGCSKTSEYIYVYLKTTPDATISGPPLIEAGESFMYALANPPALSFKNISSKTWDWGDGRQSITLLNRVSTKYVFTGFYDITLTIRNLTACQPGVGTKRIEVYSPICQTAIPAGTQGEFYMDKSSGRIAFRKADCPANIFLGCVEGASDPDNLNRAIASSANTYSDEWDYSDYGIRRGHDNANDFELGRKGKWRPKSSYTYNTSLVNQDRNFNTGTFGVSYFNWQFEDSNHPNRWIKSTTIEKYSPHGDPIQERNARGIPSAAKFGYNGALPYMTAQNAEYNTVLFESFENTYTREGNMYFEDNMLVNSSHYALSTEFAHSGSRSVNLKKNGRVMSRLLDLNEQIRESGLEVKVWARLSMGESKQQLLEKLYVELQREKGSVLVSSGQEGTVGRIVAQTGEWILCEFLFAKIPYTDSQSIRPVIRYSGDKEIWLDDLRIQPLNAKVGCYVYDPATLRLLTSFDDQHFGLYYQYNAEGKLVRKQLETEKGIKTVQETHYHLPEK
jgi:uncharacterized repeat protein (TIGR01451 family)